MNSKRKLRKRRRTTSQKIKYSFFILLSLTFPINYLGLSFNPQNNNDTTIHSGRKIFVPTNLEINRYEANSSNLIHNASDQNTSVRFVICSVLTSVVSTFLLTMIWKYFDDVPGAKQSVLLYLYKDICAIMFITQWIWVTVVIACFLSGDTTVGEFLAMIISFSFEILELQALVTLNTISVLRLSMMRQRAVDPQIPWGENETKAIRNIRYITFLCVSIFVSVPFFCKSYPQIYYYLLGDERSLLNLPK
jgi:hypothetical protein